MEIPYTSCICLKAYGGRNSRESAGQFFPTKNRLTAPVAPAVLLRAYAYDLAEEADEV